MNTVTIIGRVDKEPQIYNNSNGDSLHFIVLDEEKYIYKGEEITKTNRMPISIFGKDVGKFYETIKQGMIVAVNGKVSIKNKQLENGEWRTYISILPNFINGIEVIYNNCAPKQEQYTPTDAASSEPPLDW